MFVSDVETVYGFCHTVVTWMKRATVLLSVDQTICRLIARNAAVSRYPVPYVTIFFNRQGESVVFIVVKFELCFVLCFPPFLLKKNFKEGSV